MTPLAHRISRAIDVANCVVKRTWRPACCVGFVGSLLVNGIAVPLINKTPADLTGLAALVAAITAAFAVREVGKKWGTAE